MKINVIACIIICLSIGPTIAYADTTHIPGYVTHGVNTYNANPIADYSNSTLVPWLHIDAAVREIGVLAEGESDAEVITADTNRSRLVATTRSFFDFFNPDGEIDDKLVNRPLNVIGSNFFGFTAVDDRILPMDFPAAGTGPEVHRAKKVIAAPTVADWERIRGKMTVKTRKNGTSVVRITIRDAFPNSVYTLWDIGARKPLQADETGYAIPLGGIPNVMTTNAKGCAYKRIIVSYPLLRDCEQGAEFCSNYISAFYHWDGQVYGASPAATWANAPTGIYAGNQIVWPTSGELLQEPATDFGYPRYHGCY